MGSVMSAMTVEEVFRSYKGVTGGLFVAECGVMDVSFSMMGREPYA